MRTNSLKILAALLIFTLASGCAEEKAADMKLTMVSSMAFVIPKGQYSCYALRHPATGATATPDVSENSFSFKNLSVQWVSTSHTAEVIYMTVEVKHSNIEGGSYKCTLSGQEIAAMFNDGTSDWDQTFPSAITKNSSCPLTCGSFKVVDKTKQFTATGTVRIVGIQTDISSKEQSTISTQDTVQVNYPSGI